MKDGIEIIVKGFGRGLQLTVPDASVQSAILLRPEAQMSTIDSSNPNGGPSYQGPRYRPNGMAARLTFVAVTYLSAALIRCVTGPLTYPSTSPAMTTWVG